MRPYDATYPRPVPLTSQARRHQLDARRPDHADRLLRLCRALFGGRRQLVALGRAADGALRRRPCPPPCDRLRGFARSGWASPIRPMRFRCCCWSRWSLPGASGWARSAGSNSGRLQLAALGTDEDHAGAGARALSARARTATRSRVRCGFSCPLLMILRAGGAGADAAQSWHRDAACASEARCFFFSPDCPGAGSRRRRWRWRIAIPFGLAIPAARLSEAARADIPQSGFGRAGRRLEHSSGEDRSRLRRPARQRLPDGHPEPAQLPARETDRFHHRDHRRGVRLLRPDAAARACSRR